MIESIELKKITYSNDLIVACTNLKYAVLAGEVSTSCLFPFVEILNKIFDNRQCVDFLYTNNTDNVIFGINVNPTITNTDLVDILIGTEEMNLGRYSVELDSKLVDVLDAEELAAFIVDEIDNIMSSTAITNVRAYIDIHLTENDASLDLRNSVNYSQILIYGIKDTINKLNSVMYKLNSDSISTNEYAVALELSDTLEIVQQKLKSIVFGNDVNSDDPKMSVLDWVFLIYKDIEHEYKDAQETLKNAKLFTGSVNQKDEIDKTIKALGRASSEVLSEGAKIIEEATKKISLFKNLKQNGLRGIESDLYEYKVRVKNCTDEDDAIYILRCIMTRINILQDYINNNPDISDAEAARWQSDIDAYMNLRAELSAKKVGAKAQYGVFVDYNRLDELDNPNA